MNLSQFEDNLDRYGADLSRWPAEMRTEAAALKAGSSQARAVLRKMVEIEAVLLAPSPGAHDVPGVAERMAARAVRHRQARPGRPAARRVGWASAAAAALVLGVFVGDLASKQRDESPSTVFAAAFDMPGDTDVE